MHLIFERSNGRFKSNCNILALAWMPYYNEPTFRRTHLDYHHRLLAYLTGPPTSSGSGIQDGTQQEPWRHHDSREASRQSREGNSSRGVSADSLTPMNPRRATVDLEQNNTASRHNNLELALKRRCLSNSRLYEQYQRFVYMKCGSATSASAAAAVRNGTARLDAASELAELSDASINDFVDELYGRMPEFGWLAIGNIGRMIGVTLTSTVQSPTEIDGRRPSSEGQFPETNCNGRDANDLIVLCDDKLQEEGTGADMAGLPSTSPSGKTSNTRLPRPDRKCARDNHNLRGHLDEIILVKWNELYQKLASVDSKGNVLIWSKTNDKFTIQTPFYNKSKSVADFKWSNDGKTALICYTDSFILVGGSSGQRHWHSMLNLEDYHITCATWAPDDEQLLLGVSNGNVVVIDLPTSELTELVVGQANIRALCWSSSEINLRHLSSTTENESSTASEQRRQKCEASIVTGNEAQSNQNHPEAFQAFGQAQAEDESEQHASVSLGAAAAVVNRRRLSRNCAIFCRYRPPTTTGHQNQSQHHGRSSRRPSNNFQPRDILTVDFADNTIKLFSGGLGDPKPRQIQVNLESYLVAWSSDGKILAVAGFNIYTSAPSVGYLRCKYLNAIKFYNQRGDLIHERRINFTRYPITALTWAHDDQRLFVATGPRLHCARVYMGIPKLSLLSLSCLQRHTKLMDKSDVLKQLINKQMVASVLNWQSFNCPLELGGNLIQTISNSARVKTANQRSGGPPTDVNNSSALKPMLMGSSQQGGSNTSSSSAGGSESSGEQANLMNNINIANYQLPAKLKSTIDQLFLQTIRQPYDEQLTLNDIAWHVPKNRKRHYCTLICYTHELADIGCVGHQYKAQELLANQNIGLTGSESRDSDQFKIFILYAEFAGSLIPILKARRVGFLKPEFVLFDPEDGSSNYYQRNHKVADVSNERPLLDRHTKSTAHKQSRQLLADDNILASNCVALHGAHCNDLIGGGRQATSSETTNCRPAFLNTALIGTQSKSLVSSPLTGNRYPRSLHQDQQLFYLLKISLQQSREKIPTSSMSALQHEVLKAIERQRFGGLEVGTSGGVIGALRDGATQSGARSLPEKRELIRIKSNIWGTKFKLINMGNRKIGSRAVLGGMKYKASLLHLQPRQIFLNLKDMSNYCILCSMHHHTSRIPQKRPQCRKAQTTTSNEAPTSTTHPVDLLDLQIGLAPPPSCIGLATPMLSSSRRQSRTRQRLERQDQRRMNTSQQQKETPSNEKILLPVGDNIRVAPKLEPNQRYKLMNGASPSPARASNLSSLRQHSASSLVAANFRSTSSGRQSRERRDLLSAQDSGCHSVDDMPCDSDNDILTLSLDQRDRVQVEMSSASAESEACKSGEHQQAQKMDDFLQANKTLKSIQTITRMIVDLSSRAHDDNNNSDLVAMEEPSPIKLLKKEDGGAVFRSPAREYIPPDTPVHRPRRFANNKRAELLQRTQSATNSPFGTPRATARHFYRDATTSNTPSDALEHKSLCLHPDDPLPAPPPSVPFRRKLSSSAKRFFDGSLRSFASMSGVSGSGLGGYLTSDDHDSEDCESLVQRRHRSSVRRSRAAKTARALQHHQSQPCTPSRVLSTSFTSRDPDGKQSILDLASLRSQVVQKIRQSTNWVSTSMRHLDKEAASSSMGASHEATRRQSSRSSRRHQHARSSSCTGSSRWVHKSTAANKHSLYLEQLATPEVASSLQQQSPTASGGSSSSDLISLISSSDSSSDLSSGDDDATPAKSKEFGFLDQNTRSKLFKNSSKLSSSVLEFSMLKRSKRSNSSSKKEKLPGANEQPSSGGSKRGDIRRPPAGSERRRAKRSICPSANCCCAREFKLTNRPPVWNEHSQVYQLDFGGRVTQESAKNLQIDFNGNLALQFGRIDKCTYTLDYQFPFNAVQAMSIALASLTQRLK